jgi:hypothetical protein
VAVGLLPCSRTRARRKGSLADSLCSRNANGGSELATRSPFVLAQRAASEGPRWTRAVEWRPGRAHKNGTGESAQLRVSHVAPRGWAACPLGKSMKYMK